MGKRHGFATNGGHIGKVEFVMVFRVVDRSYTKLRCSQILLIWKKRLHELFA